MIDKDLASFIESPVMQIVGTSGQARKPEIGRGAGAWTSADRETIHLVVSSWQWPETIANLKATERIAVTFSRPSDYVSYQVKGDAALRPAEPDEIDRSARYLVAIVSALMRLGMSPETIAPWMSNRDAMLVSVRVSSIFVQTPGAKAGTRLWSTGG